MLTPSQISAESQTPVLTDEQVMNLSLLVKRFPVYVRNLALFPDLKGKLEAEQAIATVVTQGLKAVLTKVDELPDIDVESQGDINSPAHFSTQDNWNTLALDVLNLLYDLPAGLLSHQTFAVTVPNVEKFLINDNTGLVAQHSLRKL